LTKNLEALRERFQRDDWAVQLGNIASNLARLAKLPEHLAHRERVESLLLESEYFIEWAVPKAPMESQEKLVDLQLQLALWRHAQPAPWFDPLKRTQVRREAQEWSDRVMEMSGLLSSSQAVIGYRA
jgi:hypothetical protein